MIRHHLIAPRTDLDVSLQYIRARVAGLEVSHGPASTKVFDSVPGPDVELGVFRYAGTLVFHKESRQWESRACSNANAVDLSTLISLGLWASERFGRSPGQWTRRRCWVNQPSLRSGRPVAWADVCYRLGEADLLGHTAEAVTFTDEALRRVLDEATA